MLPGSLMKALVRPGAGEKTPTEGDQVDLFIYYYYYFSLSSCNCSLE